MDMQTQARILERSIPEPNSGCWLWIRHLNRDGYGHVSYQGRMRLAHRVAYEAFQGPIPGDLPLDHLCRNRACVNPDHLEPVTSRVNFLRGQSPNAIAHKTGICKRGHVRSPENTIEGTGACRACVLPYWREYQKKRKARLRAERVIEVTL